MPTRRTRSRNSVSFADEMWQRELSSKTTYCVIRLLDIIRLIESLLAIGCRIRFSLKTDSLTFPKEQERTGSLPVQHESVFGDDFGCYE
jgi:hypothetical protein